MVNDLMPTYVSSFLCWVRTFTGTLIFICICISFLAQNRWSRQQTIAGNADSWTTWSNPLHLHCQFRKKIFVSYAENDPVCTCQSIRFRYCLKFGYLEFVWKIIFTFSNNFEHLKMTHQTYILITKINICLCLISTSFKLIS